MKRKKPFLRLGRKSRLVKRWNRPGWMWEFKHLFSGFILFFGIGMALASVQFSAVHFPAQAASTDNLMGWIWADPAGWFSANSDNPGSCIGTCGTYGMGLDLVTKRINGFAWSDVAGWVCFGSSCSATASCNGTPPAGSLLAWLDTAAGTVQAHGWGKVCNQGNDGWISLNCAEPGVCASVSPYYKVVFNPSTGYFSDAGVSGSSFGWNGTSIGTGYGYMDFRLVNLRSETLPFCNDGIDNDLDGLSDCQETGCSTAPNCVEDPTNGNCGDGIDNDLDGIKDCQEAACKTAPVCAETPTNGNKCEDGIDDDGDGLIDCMDTGCAGYPTCTLIGEAACGTGYDACCSDTVDNDGNGTLDCSDPNCLLSPYCTPAWLQAKFGNVYAQQGITGETTPSGQTLSSGTYCLTTKGAITGFQSGAGCSETGAQSLTLPKSGTGYSGTLGSLDIPGILSGRYGKVVDYTGYLPDVLDGKVYKAVGNVTLGTKQFQNGSGATQRGNGLLIVEGDLIINGDLSYQSNALTQYLRNLASFGVIVKKNPSTGTGGNLYIRSNVTNVVGAYFAESSINTGTTGGTDVPLRVLGLMASFRMNLQRVYKDPTIAAESVVFDGRAVANPPPGMQEISKSLPTSKDAF